MAIIKTESSIVMLGKVPCLMKKGIMSFRSSRELEKSQLVQSPCLFLFKGVTVSTSPTVNSRECCRSKLELEIENSLGGILPIRDRTMFIGSLTESKSCKNST